ncbi:hypothetical protein HYH02_009461 [Chlamydomonas schloesseri]|uniref:Uncharacterized protein n=1 Tax=Chlamydomonas schloesseri TaxID=2026947 RepID=A0A835TPQ9_9CHLO|nr:hypothetical protein HYH02_009461 [Chlamydomonas schloesseri]|eukprot:KAG2443046.1 hypothetical protein HYH02_009461 [Chlamydomonas schloesseri]
MSDRQPQAAPLRCVVRSSSSSTAPTAANADGKGQGAISAAAGDGPSSSDAPVAPVVSHQTTALSEIKAGTGPWLRFSTARVGQLVVRGPGWSEENDKDGGPGGVGVLTSARTTSYGTPEVTVHWCRTGMVTTDALRHGGTTSGLCLAVVDVVE